MNAINQTRFGLKGGSRPLSEVTTRNATLFDVDAIMNIETESFSTPWPHEAFAQEIEGQEWSRVVLACWDSKVVGFMVYWMVEDEMHLSNLAVKKKWRNMGVGRRLVNHLLEEGLKNKLNLVFLEVRVSNRVAIGLYKSFGFEELDLRKGYYADDGEDALVMYLRLG